MAIQCSKSELIWRFSILRYPTLLPDDASSITQGGIKSHLLGFPEPGLYQGQSTPLTSPAFFPFSRNSDQSDPPSEASWQRSGSSVALSITLAKRQFLCVVRCPSASSTCRYGIRLGDIAQADAGWEGKPEPSRLMNDTGLLRRGAKFHHWWKQLDW